MSGIGRLIVGYRDGDPRIRQLWLENGQHAVPHKGCINCGRMTWFVPSGQDAIRSRDPEPICEPCWQDRETHDAVYAEI